MSSINSRKVSLEFIFGGSQPLSTADVFRINRTVYNQMNRHDLVCQLKRNGSSITSMQWGFKKILNDKIKDWS